jgi:hypothetical protein
LKILFKIIKFLGIGILPICLISALAFYTHPTYFKSKFVAYFPEYRNKEFSFKGFLAKNDCKEYESRTQKLNDRYLDYIWNSAYQKFGEILTKKEEIRPYFLEKKLEYVDSSDFYVVDTLFHSYSFLTTDAKILLEDIGKSFKEKLKNTNLEGTRIRVTSLLRTQKSVRKLMRRNRNSVKVSSHLHGTTFDLSYYEYAGLRDLNWSEKEYLREILAETLAELRNKDRCFVTFELRQACFHVVNKRN